MPWVFTEHGAILAATLLHSPQAIALSVFVVRAFVRLRDEVLTHAALARRIESIDRKLLEHDAVLREFVEKILPLLRDSSPEEEPAKPPIGFHGVHRHRARVRPAKEPESRGLTGCAR